MEKVKVSRYVTGKRPEYAPLSSDEEEEEEEEEENDEEDEEEDKELKEDDEEEGEGKRGEDDDDDPIPAHLVQEDRRLRRLMGRKNDGEDRQERILSHRRLVEPEVLGKSDDEEEEEEIVDDDYDDDDDVDGMKIDGDASDAEELDEEEIERRREAIRNKLRGQKRDEDLLKLEDETLENEKADDAEGEDEDEYSDDDDDDDEEEEGGPRLKPVFVRKQDRLTLQERDKEEEKVVNQEHEVKKKATERRLQTLKIVDTELKKDLTREQAEDEPTDDFQGVRSDGENEAEEFEAWKVRNLRYIKRDRDEKETAYKEKMELERIHNMTEEERRLENKLNPKIQTNKMNKGKYKFLQKYYHRGAFYLDKEDTVYKRDFTAPTLEDHFNKTILPQVMQVKNFGRSGRTKYTHLVDQDTTKFEAAWVADTAMNLKFHASKGAGMKQVFEKPSVKRKKVE